MLEQHKYLTNCVLIIIVCGVILAYIGNYIIKGSNYRLNTDNNITTCDKSILNKLASQEDKVGENGYIIGFTGNIITAAGILFIMLLSALFSVKKDEKQADPFTVIKNMISGSLPSLLTLAIIIYIIILNSIYRENLVNGHVANEYYSYSSFLSILVLIQIGLLIKYIVDMSENKNSPVKPVIYIFSIINIMILGIMQVILNFFSTDG